MSLHVQYRHSRCRPNYIVHVSNNVDAFFFFEIFPVWLVESTGGEPKDMGGSLVSD